MKHKNKIKRLEEKRRAFENSGLKSKPGFKAPGSLKKN